MHNIKKTFLEYVKTKYDKYKPQKWDFGSFEKQQKNLIYFYEDKLINFCIIFIIIIIIILSLLLY